MRLGYARCSTDEQAEALAAQVARLQGAGCDRIVQELESGRSDDRLE
jgi:DNA invertase Pin-like site-specific DNA recombinase